MIGIYKITSPSGKIYIGQSKNIEKRLYVYSKNHCKTQPLLYNSLNKYGYECHEVIVIKECDIEDLNYYERFFQDKFDVLGKNGLNLVLTSTAVKSAYVSPVVVFKRNNTLSTKPKFLLDKTKNETLLNVYTKSEFAKKISKSLCWVCKLVKRGKVSTLTINGTVLIIYSNE